jgi:thiol-disulfide isomerase/thioredoxin
MSDFLRQNIPVIVAAVAVVGLWLLLRNKATRLDSMSDFDAKVAKGQPLVLEFFSNGWMRCLASKPIVNGIENDLKGKADVIHLNMLSRLGREIAGRYEVKGAPTTIILNNTGDVVYQHAGLPNRKTVVGQVMNPAAWKTWRNRCFAVVDACGRDLDKAFAGLKHLLDLQVREDRDLPGTDSENVPGKTELWHLAAKPTRSFRTWPTPLLDGAGTHGLTTRF